MHSLIKLALLVGAFILFVAIGALIQQHFGGTPQTNGPIGPHMSPLINVVIRGTET